MGESLQSAIDRGLTEAWEELMGGQLNQKYYKTSEQVNIKNQTEEYLSSSEYQDQIKSTKELWIAIALYPLKNLIIIYIKC